MFLHRMLEAGKKAISIIEGIARDVKAGASLYG